MGYTWSVPRFSPNALYPSKRTPAVTKYRSLKAKRLCTRKPPVTTRSPVTSGGNWMFAELTVCSPGPGKPTPSKVTRVCSRWTSWPPTESVALRFSDTGRCWLAT